MKRSVVTLLAVLLVASLWVGSALAYCDCSSSCSGAGCDYLGDGGCWQTLFHRCDGGSCGNYDPLAEDCQYMCEWKSYYCQQP